ncbi:MAG: S8 family serine peptidase [Gammaproteobacteria bacterium]|nr:S8 family serine peptidase [Gammaproteobacteria bacterium]
MGSPGCVANAISVCSTTDSDVMSSFTNISATTDVCAAGSSITSSVSSSNTAISTKSGTSMSAPYVTGLTALLREAGCSTADEIESVLESTGTPITNTRSGGIHTKPRVNALAAVEACLPEQPNRCMPLIIPGEMPDEASILCL